MHLDPQDTLTGRHWTDRAYIDRQANDKMDRQDKKTSYFTDSTSYVTW